MKTSNKILLGAIGFIVLCMLTVLIYLRSNVTTQEHRENSGDWQTQQYETGSFQEIAVHTAANIYLSQGETKVEVKGTEDMLSKIDVKVEDGKLTVKNKQNFGSNNWSGQMSIYVSTDSLTDIRHSGAGSIESSTTLTFPQLNVRTSGANDASLQIECQKFKYHQTGVGSVNIMGKAEGAAFVNTGAGSMDASEFEVKQANINGTGVGSFYVHVTEQLNINLSGAGSVNYKGNPRIQQNVSGIGSVSAM